MAKKETQSANLTRAQKAKAEHEKKSDERKSAAQTIKTAYLSGDGERILEDLQKKIKTWMALNNKVAQDGVGARATGYKLEDGSPEVENIYLTPEQRASYLDQSKGQQAILDYIERQLEQPKPDAKPKTKQKETTTTE